MFNTNFKQFNTYREEFVFYKTLFTFSEVNAQMSGIPLMPFFLTSGNLKYLAMLRAYMLEMEPPGQNMASPSSNPIFPSILSMTTRSIREKTGETSYVYRLAFKVSVNQHPPKLYSSRPPYNWLKNLGCAVRKNKI